MATLSIRYADGHVEERALSPGSHMIGREGDCGLFVPDPSISRHHARILTDRTGAYFVEDNRSKNGTLVNGRRIRRHRLQDGDRISLGAVELVFHERSAAGTSTTLVVLGDHPVNMEAASFASPHQQLVLNQRRLKMLYDLSDRLTTLRDRSELLTDVMEICFETLQFERGLIALKHPRGQDPEWPVIRNLKQDASGRLTISRTIINRALLHGERCIINDPVTDLEDPSVSIAEFHIRSAMCVPIQYRDEILGVIYGDRTSTSTRYEQDDVDFLAGLAREVSVGLMNHRLYREHEERLQLESELAVARQIQTELYPKRPLRRQDIEAEGWNGASRRVSGDYYDMVELEDGRVAFVVADVSGKGMAAALLTANLQAAVRVLLPVADSLSEAMSRWNRLIWANTDPSKFITAVVGILDARSREFEYVSAGHPAPLLVDPSGRVTELPLYECFPLGVTASERYASRTFELPSGATLFFYTDGVTDAMRTDGEWYGEERLCKVLQHAVHHPPADLLRQIREDVTGFVGNAPQSDDITVLVVRCP